MPPDSAFTYGLINSPGHPSFAILPKSRTWVLRRRVQDKRILSSLTRQEPHEGNENVLMGVRAPGLLPNSRCNSIKSEAVRDAVAVSASRDLEEPFMTLSARRLIRHGKRS